MTFVRKIERYIRNHEKLMYILSFFYNILLLNFIKGRKGLTLHVDGAFLKRNKVENLGSGNVLVIEKGCRINRCIFKIGGNNNIIFIGNDCVCNNMEFVIADESEIKIGEHSHFVGPIHIACIENTHVKIGERSLFSSDIVFRTSDSHSILDESGKRINLAKDIIIGKHVWIGQRVIILKGTMVGDNCVIGTNALIAGKIIDNNSLVVGNPSRIVKSHINWNHNLV